MSKNKSNKKICFFCKYELGKHNKSTKCVKYNGSLKPICKYCTKNKHKALEMKNINIDTHCKICKKPTLYKKCIACSTCDHFYHGKCLDLNKRDIEKIERICNFLCAQNATHLYCHNQTYRNQT